MFLRPMTIGADSDSDSDELAYLDDSESETEYYEAAMAATAALVVAHRSEEESAADTVFWGWVVLLSTWAVFVVGMGSVAGVWEWAWGRDGEVGALGMESGCAGLTRNRNSGRDRLAAKRTSFRSQGIIRRCAFWPAVLWCGSG